jgi:ubiquinone/menaquinone biosynthesis C-methylase UbiE
VTTEPEPLRRANLPPAVRAFDETASRFDERFGAWASVAAQRHAVRRYLTRVFEPGASLLELGAGTGEDALHLLERGYRVTLTDGSPSMVELARRKILAAGYLGVSAEQLVLEDIPAFERRRVGAPAFDGVYSNFASLNCVRDPSVIAAPLARLVRPRGTCVLVVFGTRSIGEVVVELLRGRPRAALRRFGRGAAPAKLGGEHFEVWYPSPRQVANALAPWFRLRAVRGIGILVPPSAAEPWISRFPRVVGAMAALDSVLTVPLARLGDHVLVHLERTDHPAPAL